MQSIMIHWLLGYVRIRLIGKEATSLLSTMIEHQLMVWEIQVLAQQHTEANPHIDVTMRVRDFFQLRHLIRHNRCRVRIISRHGLPFYLDKLIHRKAFLLGGMCCLASVWICSSLIWQISIVGNEKLSTQEILSAAASQGIHRFQWKFRLGDPNQLSRELHIQLPGAAWVGVEIRGTHVMIQVVEASLTEMKSLESPCHLVATKNALITEMITLQGKPIVKPNTYVRQGDILISGVIGDEQHTQNVVAKGTVKGIVWYHVAIESPLLSEFQVYTGNEQRRHYIVWRNRALQVKGPRDAEYMHFKSIPDHKVWQWRKYIFPLSWVVEHLREVKILQQTVDRSTAKKQAIAKAKKHVLERLDEQSQMISEKILHEQSDSDKVYLKLLFEVEEPIMFSQPIVEQGE